MSGGGSRGKRVHPVNTPLIPQSRPTANLHPLGVSQNGIPPNQVQPPLRGSKKLADKAGKALTGTYMLNILISSDVEFNQYARYQPQTQLILISHFHQAIFIHIPKNAGQSIELSFLSDIGLSYENRAPLLLRPRVNCDNNSPPRLAHLTARQYVELKYIPQKMYTSYYKFCVCRNPWDRAFSLYKFLTDQSKPFNQFVKDDFTKKIYKELHWFAMNQARFIQNQTQDLLVDRVIRFERLESEFNEVATRLNLKTKQLTHTNKSNNSKKIDYREAYCEKSKRIIADLYQEDINLFGYSFDK